MRPEHIGLIVATVYMIAVVMAFSRLVKQYESDGHDD